MTVHPTLERRNLPLDDVHGHGLLFRVAPVDVEPGFDARCEQKRDTCLAANLLGVAIGQLGHELNDAARGVAEKVNSVLNLPGSG